MSARPRLAGLFRPALLSLSLSAISLLGGSGPAAAAEDAYFFGLVTRTPMVHVPLAGTATYAVLIGRLRAEGYADVKLTPLSPNRFDPRPELMHPDLTITSADTDAARETTVHRGWNGTAVKGGQTFEVYVDRAPR